MSETRNLGDFVSRGPNFKYKYLDEEGPNHLHMWFVHGVHPNGNVDIVALNDEVFTNVPKDLANELIAIRDVFVESSIAAIRNFARRQEDLGE